MDMEARSLQPSLKAMFLAKLREYKSDLNNLKGEVKKITSPKSALGAREELLESGMADTLMVCSEIPLKLVIFSRSIHLIKSKFFQELPLDHALILL